MSTADQREKNAAYMRAYNAANKQRISAQRRARYAEDPAKKAAQDKLYRARVAEKGGLTTVQKARDAAKSKKWRERHPQAAAEAKRKYLASEKGRTQKRKEEAVFVANGGRAKAERKRAEKPISVARKSARSAYAVARRSGERGLDEWASFVLREAAHLRQLRFQLMGTKWHIDHIFPVSKGGRSTPDNLQVVPALWNRRKSNVHAERFIGA